jgi:chorismate mutase
VAALAAIDTALDAGGTEERAAPLDATAFAIPDLGERSPELKQTRDHIDAVDRAIVRLLGQRADLQARAARAKAALGAPVLDGAREAEVLGTRRAWAREAELDADGVADVFRAVLTMSRRGQRA